MYTYPQLVVGPTTRLTHNKTVIMFTHSTLCDTKPSNGSRSNIVRRRNWQTLLSLEYIALALGVNSITAITELTAEQNRECLRDIGLLERRRWVARSWPAERTLCSCTLTCTSGVPSTSPWCRAPEVHTEYRPCSRHPEYSWRPTAAWSDVRTPTGDHWNWTSTSDKWQVNFVTYV